ncbi:hypothetical protein PAXRUDRAFT_148192, partial [Paxillus rubicundulus Ve08.2h10]
ADIVHNPGSGMDSPGSQPLSVGLEGEKRRWLACHIKPMDTDSPCAKVDGYRGDQKMPRGTVGAMDGKEHGPNEPTEPPDEKEGGRGRDGEGMPTVKDVEAKGPRRAEEPGDKGDKGDESREIEGEAMDKVENDSRPNVTTNIPRPPTPLMTPTDLPTSLTHHITADNSRRHL